MKVDIYFYFMEYGGLESLSFLFKVIQLLDRRNCDDLNLDLFDINICICFFKV